MGTSREPHDDTGWMSSALCRDEPPAVFFPNDGVGVLIAVQICEKCPVRAACLEFALANHIEHGVWGGVSERQRRRILRARRSRVG